MWNIAGELYGALVSQKPNICPREPAKTFANRKRRIELIEEAIRETARSRSHLCPSSIVGATYISMDYWC
jgi:hypothetical protein